MGSASKELLQLEHKKPSSSLESTLLVCQNDSRVISQENSDSQGKPITAPIPKSQVLGKVRDFLGVISEANERLQFVAKDNSENYDIEALTGNESQVIEMDLVLGIADLHTPDAVAAAESAISGCQPVVPLAVDSSETESEDSSDDEEEDSDYNEGDDNERQDKKLERSNSVKDNSVSEDGGNKSKKRPKIVELS